MHEENEQKVHFILTRGKDARKDFVVSYYSCNRSGNFSSKSSGIRQLRYQGTIKTNFTCCAQIIKKVYQNHIEVTYFKEHYKHNFVSAHLPSSSAVKDIMKGKIFLYLSRGGLTQFGSLCCKKFWPTQLQDIWSHSHQKKMCESLGRRKPR